MTYSLTDVKRTDILFSNGNADTCKVVCCLLYSKYATVFEQSLGIKIPLLRAACFGFVSMTIAKLKIATCFTAYRLRRSPTRRPVPPFPILHMPRFLDNEARKCSLATHYYQAYAL